MTIEEFCRVTGLVNFICCLIFAVFIFLKNPTNKANQTFSIFSFLVSFWSLGYFLWLSCNDYESAYFWVRFMVVGCLWIPAPFLHFVLALLEINTPFHRYFLIVSYLVTIIYTCFITTPLLVSAVESRYWFQFWPVPGILWSFYTTTFFIVVTLAHYLLFRETFRARGIRRKQLTWVSFGTLFAYLCGATNFFLWYKIPIPPVFNVFDIIYIVFVFYAVLNYRFLEVEDILAIHRDKLMLLGLMSSSLTHEIKNPLFLIKGYTDKISAIAGRKNDSEIMEAISKLSGQVSRMSTLVTRLSDFGKPNPNPGMPEEIDIAQTLEDALFFAEQELKHHNIELVKNIDSDLPKLKGDRSQFEEIFLNLIVNAYHSMPNGGTLTITASSVIARRDDYRRSNLSTQIASVSNSAPHPNPLPQSGRGGMPPSFPSPLGRGQGEGIFVIISDTGSGIPKDALKNIFKPFYTTKGKSGTGLGLHIVKTLVEQNGGKISVESEVGKGTKFNLVFKS